MAEKNEKQKPNLTVVGGGNSAKCTVSDCKSHPQRAGFCSTHFEWFKEGLVTVKGEKAKDFEKKHQWYMNKHNKVA